ncbi:MAG: hypothetical protein K6U89_15985 [Chloroflexi bacterium]|nr:hypothetical protein [Chloroflexota bacterium]
MRTRDAGFADYPRVAARQLNTSTCGARGVAARPLARPSEVGETVPLRCQVGKAKHIMIRYGAANLPFGIGMTSSPDQAPPIGATALLGGWEVAPAFPGEAPTGWLPAVLPGDVRLSLIAAGVLPDPLVGRQLEAGRWVEERDWVFRRQLPPGPGRRFLVFSGIDYRATVSLAGREVGRHEGMFAARRYEVPAVGGEVVVRCAAPATLTGPPLDWRARLLRAALQPVLGGELFPRRLGVPKLQMAFGWDFAPALPTVGIWDEVTLETTGPLALTDLQVVSWPGEASTALRVTLTVDAAAALPAELEVQVEEAGGQPIASSTCRWQLSAGESRHRVALSLPPLARWEPWERGVPTRYRLRARLLTSAGLSDEREVWFGVRTVQVAAPEGGGRAAPAKDWVRLMVNGRSLFLRGANWVPNDALLGRLRPEDYRQRLEQARAAGVNLLRVWGGGLRERRAFYDLCDELGILVWQEFPFSVAFFDSFPRTEAYLRLVEAEARAIVRALRNHPSLVIWCGGNEFSPRRNRPLVDRLAHAVAQEDGTRPFRAASPGAGERHHWRVWHGKANLADYRRERAPLLSEFGLQAAPSVASLRAFLPDDIAPGPDWEYHSAQLAKLRRYAGEAMNAEQLVAASQRAQAQGLQLAIEHSRRQKWRTCGTIFWQLNDPWGAMSWSVIDYYGRPKAAYARLRGCYAPVLVTIEFPLRAYRQGDWLEARLWVVNDTLTPLDRLELEGQVAGQVVFQRRAVAAANAVTALGSVRFQLPATAGLVVTARRLGTLLCENHYDLQWEDHAQIAPLAALRDWLTWRVLH